MWVEEQAAYFARPFKVGGEVERLVAEAAPELGAPLNELEMR